MHPVDIHFISVGVEPDAGVLLSRLGLDADSDEAADFVALFDRVAPLAQAKAAILEAPVERADDDGLVVVGGVEFRSELLADNLRGHATVWPYVATCGRELYDHAQSIPDPFERYWVEEIMQHALSAARGAVDLYVAENLHSGKVAAFGPGSLPEWPLEEQVPLFRLLGEGAARCGVVLTDSLLMLPNKSVSGFIFPNEHGFVSCRLCPRDRCPNRKADYDAQGAPQFH